jgi:hypothetical protein
MKKISFNEAATKILIDAVEPMSTKEIIYYLRKW